MADNDNTGLALIVGGLVVAAAIFGFAVWGPPGTSMSNIQPAAGVPAYTTSTTTHEKNTVITPPSETGDPGNVSTTTTRTKTETQNP